MNRSDDFRKKSINFDLSTNELKKVFNAHPLEYLKAYSQIKKFMENNGFKHRQFSGYISKEPMTTSQITEIAKKLNISFPWLKQCVEKFDVTIIDKTFDLTHLFTQTELPLKLKENTLEEKESSSIKESYEDNLRKALNFDLDTNELKKIYKTDNPRDCLDAYKKIEAFLTSRGFVHRQYSGYITKKEMTFPKVIVTVQELNKTFPWLKQCVQKFDVTSIGNTFDLINIFKQPNLLEAMRENTEHTEEIPTLTDLKQLDNEQSPAFISLQQLHDNAAIAQEIYDKSPKQQTRQNNRSKNEEL